MELQLRKLADLLLPVLDGPILLATDPQAAVDDAVDELRLRIKAAMLDLESAKREQACLIKLLKIKH